MPSGVYPRLSPLALCILAIASKHDGVKPLLRSDIQEQLKPAPIDEELHRVFNLGLVRHPLGRQDQPLRRAFSLTKDGEDCLYALGPPAIVELGKQAKYRAGMSKEGKESERGKRKVYLAVLEDALGKPRQGSRKLDQSSANSDESNAG